MMTIYYLIEENKEIHEDKSFIKIATLNEATNTVLLMRTEQADEPYLVVEHFSADPDNAFELRKELVFVDNSVEEVNCYEYFDDIADAVLAYNLL